MFIYDYPDLRFFSAFSTDVRKMPE